MKGTLLFISLFCILFSQVHLVAQTKSDMGFHSFSILDIDGKSLEMKDFKGKYVLCVNVASECGNTPQYKQLEEMYQHYKDKLVVIGFPCNQFGGQEPGTNAEIKTFCEKHFRVSFPLTAKIDVKGDAQHPIYSWLTSQTINGKPVSPVEWNFHKYLIDPNGKLIGDFKADMDPATEELLDMIK